MKPKTRKEYRLRRHLRVRGKVRGTADRPRMAVMLSNKHMYVQFVDDSRGKTLAMVSTNGKQAPVRTRNVAGAQALGQAAAKRAKEKGITSVVFDRGGFRYHGRVRAIAEAAREEGLVL